MGARSGRMDESQENEEVRDESETEVANEEDIVDNCANDRLTRIKRARELETKHWSYQAKVRMRNSLEGVVTDHDQSTDKFSIQFGASSEIVSLARDEFVFDHEDENKDNDFREDDEELSAPQLQALRQARSLFIPGSLFNGTIAIPGFQPQHGENERQPYTFHVVSQSRDEFGKPILLARHAAYGDEQSCHLHINCSSSSASDSAACTYPIVTASWEDGETICEGIVDLSSAFAGKCTVRGDVKQLLHGEKGFYERGTAISHTFELSRVTTCRAEAKHNVLLGEAQSARVAELSSGFWLIRNDLSEQLHGLEMPWRDIVLRDACRVYEDACATLRRHSLMLDDLHFESPDTKEATLKSFAAVGIDRASRHAEIDKCLAGLNIVIAVAARYSPSVEEDIPYTRFKAQHRLLEHFHRFDQSLKAAEGRIPKSILDRWRRSGSEAAGLFCTVCSLSEESNRDEVFAELPCGHWYHFECVKGWLHAHRTCPNCRMDLSVEKSSCQASDIARSSDCCEEPNLASESPS